MPVISFGPFPGRGWWCQLGRPGARCHGLLRGPFPRTARRTRRATFTAAGSPRRLLPLMAVWLMVSTGSGCGSRGSGTG